MGFQNTIITKHLSKSSKQRPDNKRIGFWNENVKREAVTERFRKSAIPSMQRLLNKDDKRKRDMFKIIENSVPVNYDSL